MDINDVRAKMLKSIDFFSSEIKKLRTGRANTALVEDIKVDVYGSSFPVSQVATITTPESNIILVSPWDKSQLNTISQTILSSNIGFNPVISGDSIRIVVPPLSEERRKEFIKLLNSEAENTKISLRNIRKDYIDDLKKQKEEGSLSEDELKVYIEKIDSLIQEMNSLVENISKTKERDLLEI
jgi:ribosome recycling factor